jgi:glyoxylase-like metal-dependent hydrolase (beta-lactamase superfamily II)
MQELVPHVYIENSYPGVTLGAINWPHGILLIDSPFRPEDARSWRSALLNLGGGVDRLLVNLDSHLDRTLGVRAMECTIVGQEKMAEAFRTRPVTFKAQPGETGAAWELYGNLGSVRWAPPEVVFTNRFFIHWDSNPITLEHRPGPNPGAVWVTLPDQKIVFVGDAVVANQPPFLSLANLPVWIDMLKLLSSPEYNQFMIISGRGGIVSQDDVRRQLRLIEHIHQAMEAMANRNAAPEESYGLVDTYMDDFRGGADNAGMFQKRLRYGMYHYYVRHYHSTETDELAE